MPFIPPVSIARSVSGLSGKERHISNSPTAPPAKTSVQRDDKGSTVKERLTSNLKQLSRKSQPRTFLPATKEAPRAEVRAKRRDTLSEGFPASSSGKSLSKPARLKKGSTQEKTRDGREEQVRFTLTLTPEAVLLLQRRNSERRQRSASRNTGNGGGVSVGALDTRRRRDNTSKRLHTATQRQPLTPNTGTNTDAGLGDITSFMKISLLNEQHKYDDVEYEEEQDGGVDERVVLKCTEWLRGLENTPVTVGNGLHAV
ncbi:proline-rich protein 18-like [Takifugu rubripes]|uniref:Proline-rich protein 18-like n=1 Tax=Takifugu rubripes TaxID=31033 RepID=A0A3B5KRB8_TAKRU|nr:proline-rich protein 18-like [Takifugu rubripes]|eukprot:XP_011611169.1 PREDICTED: proline-rich protein 18-like [Takifugu rubripes]